MDNLKSCIEEIAGGVLLTIHVKPKSKRNSLRFYSMEDPIEISLTEIAQIGRANRQLFEFLKKTLLIKRSSMMLISGPKSSLKTLLIKGVNGDQMRQLVVVPAPNQ